jgi:hypothetical protein
MRMLAVAIAALVWASTAVAALPPPGYHPTLKLTRANETSSLTTCSANKHGRKSRTEKRLVPVACEQPPRSKVSDLGGSFWFRP